MSVLARYHAALASGALRPDSSQEEIARRLDALAQKLAAKPRWFARPARLRGLYVWGDVGRGKSMLMDLFFDAVDGAQKRRVHFNAFMVDVHARLFAARRSLDVSDPIPVVARALAREARLLCFDEFQVTDVADAMILGRLFEQLLKDGVTIVATSNTPPARLYEGGLNRQLFLPFIDLIGERFDVVSLNGPVDYRLARMAGMRVYMTPPGADTDRAMDAAWARLTEGMTAGPRALHVLGRDVPVPVAAAGAARFDFADLCARPLGAADYIALAGAFHTIMIDHVPVFTDETRNEARRFMLLIDTLYDENAKLICSAAAAPEDLYHAREGGDPFRRTVSRLVEMQSDDYLKRGHGVRGAVAGAKTEKTDAGRAS